MCKSKPQIYEPLLEGNFRSKTGVEISDNICRYGISMLHNCKKNLQKQLYLLLLLSFKFIFCQQKMLCSLPFLCCYQYVSQAALRGFPGDSVKNLHAMQEARVRSLGGEDPLEKGMTAHSSSLAWRLHPMGREGWWTTVRGVAESQTWLLLVVRGCETWQEIE